MVALPILLWTVTSGRSLHASLHETADHLYSVLGVLFIKLSTMTTSARISAFTVQHIEISYFSLEMTLNMLCTALLIVRLLRTRRSIVSALGPTHGQMYTGLVAILVESALPNSLVSLVFLILYAKQNTADHLIINLLLQVQVRCRLLL
jgi:hypothetical protein